LIAVSCPLFYKGIIRNVKGYFELFDEFHRDKFTEVTLVLGLVPKQASSLRLPCSGVDDFAGTHHPCPSRLAG
jgi:hypothetical protein